MNRREQNEVTGAISIRRSCARACFFVMIVGLIMTNFNKRRLLMLYSPTALNRDTESNRVPSNPSLSEEATKHSVRLKSNSNSSGSSSNGILISLPTALPMASPTPIPTVGANSMMTERLINDVTLFWNTTMERPWLEPNATEKCDSPMLLMTDIGWNHPDQNVGLKSNRHKREMEIFTALVNHPWFHPTAWDDIESGKMKITKGCNYYVFADVTECNDSHYPVYGGYLENLDSSFNRTATAFTRRNHPCGYSFEHFKKTKLFRRYRRMRSNNNSTGPLPFNVTLMIMDCRSNSQPDGCARERIDNDLPLSVATLDGWFNEFVDDKDQGLIPPLLKDIHLTPEEEDAIRSCRAEEDRNFHQAYIGNFRNGRHRKFHNKWGGGARYAYKFLGDNNVSIISTQQHFKKDNLTYTDVLRKARFGLAGRGDNKYSYRFTEVLAAGTIPVYHADHFVYPFRPELIDWNRCALILPEKDAGVPAMNIMNNMTAEERCERRKYCYFEIYKKFVETEAGQINGLVEGLELVSKGVHKPHPGIRCNKTSIANLDCNAWPREDSKSFD
mmetsp:Transcript_8145/g.10953  ORF Transcript_8145/g.10953 Transcript_8145/m.10953 type:complete len:558 (-) Transcript_8145:355-2028(-)